jgi:hypothetical protein
VQSVGGSVVESASFPTLMLYTGALEPTPDASHLWDGRRSGLMCEVLTHKGRAQPGQGVEYGQTRVGHRPGRVWSTGTEGAGIGQVGCGVLRQKGRARKPGRVRSTETEGTGTNYIDARGGHRSGRVRSAETHRKGTDQVKFEVLKQKARVQTRQGVGY